MLQISNFQARYYLQGNGLNQWHTQRRLDHIITTRLPQAVSDSWGRASPNSGAVYRIRNLHINLWLDELDRNDGAIADAWARLLAKAIVHALRYGTPANVVRYEDQAHYLASFLADLLAGQAWSLWLYDEFKPLKDLSPGRVAALLLSPRPDLLLPVARRLKTRQQWIALIKTMTPADVQQIWEQGLGFTNLPAHVAPEALPAWLGSSMEQTNRSSILASISWEQGQEAAFGRNRLQLYVALSSQASSIEPMVAATLSHHLALLTAFYQQRPARWLWQALATREIQSVTAIAALLDSLGLVGPALQAWLQQLLPATEGRRYLAQLAQLVAPVAATTEPYVQVQQISTSFAGLSLLLPVIRDLALPEMIGEAGLVHLFFDVVGSKLAPLAWNDPAIAWFAGLALDQMEAARQEPIVWPELDLPTTALLAAGDLLPVTQLVLHHFTSGLYGFGQSSPTYLAEQFFNQPGQLVITDEAVVVHLSQSPLGVVLQIAGKVGDQGRLPWLKGRALRIELP